jgi:hypothetical protein
VPRAHGRAGAARVLSPCGRACCYFPFVVLFFAKVIEGTGATRYAELFDAVAKVPSSLSRRMLGELQCLSSQIFQCANNGSAFGSRACGLNIATRTIETSIATLNAANPGT